MNLQERTCCFTGHRAIPPQMIPILEKRVTDIIEALIKNGIQFFGTGGALGFDALAAECVLKCRERHPQIRLILVLPCGDQDRMWKEEERIRYAKVKAQADKVVMESERYTPDCMLRRNRHLVDGSSLCVAYCTRCTGGTAYTVRYAQQRGRLVLLLGNSEIP